MKQQPRLTPACKYNYCSQNKRGSQIKGLLDLFTITAAATFTSTTTAATTTTTNTRSLCIVCNVNIFEGFSHKYFSHYKIIWFNTNLLCTFSCSRSLWTGVWQEFVFTNCVQGQVSRYHMSKCMSYKVQRQVVCVPKRWSGNRVPIDCVTHELMCLLICPWYTNPLHNIIITKFFFLIIANHWTIVTFLYL